MLFFAPSALAAPLLRSQQNGSASLPCSLWCRCTIFLLLLVCFIDDAQAHFPIVTIDDNSHVKAVQKTSLVALNVDGSDVFHVSRHYGLKQFVWDPGLRGEKNLMYQGAGCV